MRLVIHFFSERPDAGGELATLFAGLDVTFEHEKLLAGHESTLVERAHRLAEDAFVRMRGEPCVVEVSELRIADRALSRDEFAALGGQELARLAGPVEVATAVAMVDGDLHIAFEAAFEGVFFAAPRGSGGSGWDEHVVVDGTGRTVSELADDGSLVNVRLRPHVEAADHVRGRTYGGVFEAHVTIDTTEEDELARFVAFCESRGVKPIYIELARGQTPFQPMTGSYHHGEIASVKSEVLTLAEALSDAGFEVTRAKIEATGANRDIPETDAEARETPDNYFEFHVKIRVPAGADVEPLAAIATEHGAHLSRNARKTRPDGGSDRFVTLRVYDAGKVSADARFAALRNALGVAGHVMAEPIREYTVYDTNLAVDDGWLAPKT